jgi:hypothetical protein
MNTQNMPRILNTADKSTWEPSYLKFEKFSTIMKKDNFDKIRGDNYRNVKDRSGYENTSSVIEQTDVDTIRTLLSKLVADMSSRVLFGLTKDDVLPILVNRLGIVDASGSAFSIEDGLITIWANNPQPGGQVDALGAINSHWIISGKNDPGSDSKKNGRSPVHKTNFTVDTRSGVYSDEDFLGKDYDYLTGN